MGACASAPRPKGPAPTPGDVPAMPPVLTMRRSFMSAGDDDYFDAASDGGTVSEAAAPASSTLLSPFAQPGAGDAAYGGGPGLVRGLLGGAWARLAGAAGAVAALLPGSGGPAAAGPAPAPGAPPGPSGRPPLAPVRAPSRSFSAVAGGGGGAHHQPPRPSLPPRTPDGAPGVEVRPGVIVPADAVLEPEPTPGGGGGPFNHLLSSLREHHAESAAAAAALDHAPPTGCLPVVLARLGRDSVAASPRRYLRTTRPPVGASLAAAPGFAPGACIDGAYGVHPPGSPALATGCTSPRPVEPEGAIEQFTAADATSFMVRSLEYMKTKVKVGSGPALYRLVAADLYSFPFKIAHIARHLALPPPPRLSAAHAALPPHDRLPPLLVFNIQLPTYAPALLGGPVDGPGHSLVYTFALPPDWDPVAAEKAAAAAASAAASAAAASAAAAASTGGDAGDAGSASTTLPFSGPALALARRFVHNGKEADGTPTRDRLKLIARVANPVEWAATGPLNAAESKLLASYNDKPLLTRPQHKFFHGPGYLEVDLDVHQYAFLARRALASFLPRLGSVVFENAFIIQGQRPEELPEAVLAAARMVRVDLTAPRPFPAELLSDDGGVAQHAGAGGGGSHLHDGGGASLLSADALASGRGSLLSVGGRRNSSSLGTPQAAAAAAAAVAAAPGGVAGNGCGGGAPVSPTAAAPPTAAAAVLAPEPMPAPPPQQEDEAPLPSSRPASGRKSRRASSKGGGGGGGKAGKGGRKSSAGGGGGGEVVAAAVG